MTIDSTKPPFAFELAGVVVNDSVTREAITRDQMPNITPHVCRHTYCSNMAKAGMNPKTLQYLMGHSDISVTLNTYTHLGLEDAQAVLDRMEEAQNARKKQEKLEDNSPPSQMMFKAI